jgi:ATP-dependent Clp protease adapter protein ClpS
MSDVQPDARHREILFHGDDETPLPFVIELPQSVFKKQLADAFRYAARARSADDCVRRTGSALFGRG